MAVLDAEMKQLIEENTIGCVATITPDGRPAVSPKGTFLVVDEATIAFSNIRSPGTVHNVQAGSGAVEVDFIDVLRRTGCRVRGHARYTPMEATPAALVDRFQKAWPDLAPLMHGIVTIDVEGAELLRSPSYDVGGQPDALVDHWIKHYAESVGYTATRRS